MKNICFHHDDADGRMSAAIVKDAIPDCELIEIAYGFDEQEFKEKFRGKTFNKIIVVDFSFNKEIVFEIFKPALLTHNGDFIWCDHHKSAMEKYENLWNDKNVKGLRSLDKSGCRLTWEYFHPDRKIPLGSPDSIPMAILLIEDMDLWKFIYTDVTKAFAESLYHEKNIDFYINLLTNQFAWMHEVTKGEYLYKQKWQRVKNAADKGYFIDWEGYKTYVVNTPEDLSTLGNYVCNNPELNADVGLIFYEGEDYYNISLRSIGDVDVAKIAEKYGGGGHKNASGFSVKKDERTW